MIHLTLGRIYPYDRGAFGCISFATGEHQSLDAVFTSLTGQPSNAGPFSPIIDVVDHAPEADARARYEAVQAQYDRACMLRRSKQVHDLQPALNAAKLALLAAELGRG